MFIYTYVLEKDSKTLLDEMALQTILFPRPKFTLESAIKWLEAHRHGHRKVDITEHFIRFRQMPPGGFHRFYTKTLDNGIELVYGVI